MVWYDLVKALHIVAVIAWMAGLLYLPRLFVYHVAAAPGSDLDRTFQVMEKRLLRIIMAPASIAVWVLGLTMLWLEPAWLSEGWMHAKLTLVILMTGLHHAYAVWRRRLAEGRNRRTARFYRIWNEVPAVFMVGIVLLVVLKPF